MSNSHAGRQDLCKTQLILSLRSEKKKISKNLLVTKSGTHAKQ